MRCGRCRKETICVIMSRFNTDELCDTCEKKEKAHPLYQRAKEAELAACQRGDYNFPGIGKPADL